MHEWTFDDITSTVNQPLASNFSIEDSWGKADLYAENGPFLRDGADCVYGKCLDFINDSITNLNRVYRSDSVVYSSAYTISYWVNKRSACRYNGGIYTNDKWSGIKIFNENEESLLTLFEGREELRIILCFTNSTSKTLTINMNKDIYNNWHFITLSYNDNTKYLKASLDGNIFYNNVVEPSKNIRTSNNARISIGNASTYWTKGKVDDFRIYNTELSSAKIKQNYIAGLNSMLANGTLLKDEYNERLQSLAID